MPIMKLLERVRQENSKQIHPFMSEEKSYKEVYMLGVGMQALADGALDPPETDYFFHLAEAFQIDRERAETLLEQAKTADEQLVRHICKVLGKTKFAYYFIVDLQIMAHQDKEVCERESNVIRLFADLLEIDHEDVSFLTELADAVVSDDDAAKAKWVDEFFAAVRAHHGLNPESFEFYTED